MSADTLSAFWVGFIASLLLLGSIVLLLARTGRLPAAKKKDEPMQMQPGLLEKLRDLEATVRVLQSDHVSDARQLEEMRTERLRDGQRIGQLERELVDAKTRIQYLEGRLAQYETADDGGATLDTPLLAVFGPDKSIEAEDLAALRQARVPFRRIVDATKALVSRELLRRREAGDLYRWLHVGTHAGPDGMLLCDGVADRGYWNEQLTGIEGVFLAGCEDVTVADWLIGQVSWVVAALERLDNEQTGRFTKVFWEGLGRGRAPRAAYAEACRVVPQFREYTDFREAKR